MQASKDERKKIIAVTEVHKAQLFGQAQKNVELMKEILKTTQVQLDKIYTSLAQAKKQEKKNIELAENVPAPVAEVSQESVSALNDIHSSISEHNEQAKEMEVRLQLLAMGGEPSSAYTNQLQAKLDFFNKQNEALARLKERLAKLVVITGKVSFKDVSKKQLKQMIAKVEKQLQDLSVRNKALKESLMVTNQLTNPLKSAAVNDKHPEPPDQSTSKTFRR